MIEEMTNNILRAQKRNESMKSSSVVDSDSADYIDLDIREGYAGEDRGEYYDRFGQGFQEPPSHDEQSFHARYDGSNLPNNGIKYVIDNILTLLSITLLYGTLHHIMLSYITLHYVTLHYVHYFMLR